MESFDRLTVIESRLYAARCRLAIRVIAIGTLLLLAFFNAFAPNRPVNHASEVEHFYYGSIGSDLSSGVPLKVMRVLPRMFPEHLPAGAQRHDYTAFGFIQEKDRPMPIGFSIRRRFIDMTQLNCAACHTGSVRASTDSQPAIIAAMPSQHRRFARILRISFYVRR